MSNNLRSLSRCGLVLLTVSVLFVPAQASRAQADMEHGNVWSRIIKHFDGKLTKSFKDPDKGRVIEEKYDENLVLIQKRLFQFDARDRLRNGVIMDAKDNALGSTKYGYDEYDRINEERLYNAKGQLIQRKFPPGTLQGVPQNAKYSVSFAIDPNKPNELGKMKATFDPIIQPTNNADEAFVPGVPQGQPQGGMAHKVPPASTVPVRQGRIPLLPQKAR